MEAASSGRLVEAVCRAGVKLDRREWRRAERGASSGERSSGGERGVARREGRQRKSGGGFLQRSELRCDKEHIRRSDRYTNLSRSG